MENNMSPQPASACKSFDRKDVMPFLEKRYEKISREIEEFPLEIIAELIKNDVGSEKALAAVKAAKDHADKRSTRFVFAHQDGEVVLDTFRPVEFHAAPFRKQIHDNLFLRKVGWDALESPCPEFFTERKKSRTTGKHELYSAIRLGRDCEHARGIIRASQPDPLGLN
jgi:hypothetical protein